MKIKNIVLIMIVISLIINYIKIKNLENDNKKLFEMAEAIRIVYKQEVDIIDSNADAIERIEPIVINLQKMVEEMQAHK